MNNLGLRFNDRHIYVFIYLNNLSNKIGNSLDAVEEPVQIDRNDGEMTSLV